MKRSLISLASKSGVRRALFNTSAQFSKRAVAPSSPTTRNLFTSTNYINNHTLPRLSVLPTTHVAKVAIPPRFTFEFQQQQQQRLQHQQRVRSFASTSRTFNAAASSAPNPGATTSGASNYIIEMTQENYVQILQGSIPVIIDCYADWCDPCKFMTPRLEKAVEKAKGAVILAKLNVDKEKTLSDSLDIQQLPTIISVWKAQMLDKFTGLKTEEEVNKYVASVVAAVQRASGGGKAAGAANTKNSPAEQLELAQAAAKAGDITTASQIYSHFISTDSLAEYQPKAFAGLAMCALHEKKVDVAAEVMEMFKAKFGKDSKAMSDPEVTKALSIVAIAQEAGATGEDAEKNIPALEAKIKENPTDLQSRYELANAYFVAGKAKQAIDMCTEIVKRDKNWNNGAAKKLLFKFFDALGASHELTLYGRKKLASSLF